MHDFCPQCYLVAQDSCWSSSHICASFRKEARAGGAKGIAAKSSPLISGKTYLTSFVYISLASAVCKEDWKYSILFGNIAATNNIVSEERENGYSIGN